MTRRSRAYIFNVPKQDQSWYNRPTQAQIERCKQFPQHPEIKGICLKGYKPTAEDLVPRPIDMNDVALGDPTYLSLELEGMENTHIKELDVILKETFSPGHPATPNLIVHQNVAANMYWTGYVGTIRNGNDNCFETNWELALHLQKVNWSIFRGKTISIIRLFNKISNPNDKDLDLTTPIEGMKKR